MATHIWVNIGSGNGLVPGGTKPLTEPMLINHQWNSAAFTWGEFHKKWSVYISLIGVRKITSLRSQPHLPGVSELKAVLLKTLNNRHPNCKVTVSRSIIQGACQAQWNMAPTNLEKCLNLNAILKMLDFSICLENWQFYLKSAWK